VSKSICNRNDITSAGAVKPRSQRRACAFSTFLIRDVAHLLSATADLLSLPEHDAGHGYARWRLADRMERITWMATEPTPAPIDRRRLRSQRLREVNFQGDALRLGMNWTEDDLRKPKVLVESAYGIRRSRPLPGAQRGLDRGRRP